ncbi:MAG: hypothetical protein U1F27_01225 [Turneriella sp.]
MANQVASSVYLNRITVYDKKGVVIVKSHKTSEFGEEEFKKEHVANALRKGENTANLLLIMVSWYCRTRCPCILTAKLSARSRPDMCSAITLPNRYQI